jgi:hypothetical protein
MAKSNNNVITHGLTGTIGDMLVFRQRAGKTIVSNIPHKSEKEPTAQQQAVRSRFQQAILYGKTITQNNTDKAAYGAVAAPGQNAFNVAVADFFHAPDIQEINVSGYTGNKGEFILVKAMDDFMVVDVQVRIEDSNHNLVEQGSAIQESDGITWKYETTNPQGTVSGFKITVFVHDKPANESTGYVDIP